MLFYDRFLQQLKLEDDQKQPIVDLKWYEPDSKSKWLGFEIPDEFVVGYGIDYAQRNRNLPYIGKVRQISGV